MKKRGFTLICVLALVSILTYSVLGATADELNNKKNEISEKKNEATNQIEIIKGSMMDINEEIASLNEEIAGYQQEIAELNIKLAKTALDIDTTKAQLETSEKAYEKQKDLLQQRIVAMYKSGETLYLDVLLASNSIDDFISKYYFLSEIAKYDKELLTSVQTEKENYQSQKIKLEKEEVQLKALTNNKEKTSEALESTRKFRGQYLTQLSGEKKKLQEDLGQYEKDLEAIDGEILQFTMLSIDSDYAGGEMAWPVPGYYTITSGYGMRNHPVFHIWRMHTGTDIGAPEGVPVVAANDGVVIDAGYSESYGYYVLINHGGGYATMYGHASKLDVKTGDKVTRGQTIMRIGRTGWSTGPHLHFEVRINGSTVDPLPYIKSN